MQGHGGRRLAVFNFRLADALAIVVIMVLVTNAALQATDLLRRRVAPWHREGPEADA